MNCDPHWTSVLSALITPVVAIVVVYIAYRQWLTAKDKLKLDLFEKRFKVYEASIKFISSIINNNGMVSNEDMNDFIFNKNCSKWLFNEEIYGYLSEQIYERAIDLNVLNMELKDMGEGDQRTNIAHNQGEIRKWFNSQYRILDELFYPFLRLKH
jgi:hypothetical protein